MMRGKTRNSLNRFTLFDFINVFILFVIGVITVYPFYNVLLVSFNDPVDTLGGGLFFYIREFTFDNYLFFFSENDFLRAFFISVARTAIGTPVAVLVTAAFAYGVSKKYLVGRAFIIKFMLLTMYVSGGIIPYFMLIRNIGLHHNFLVYIIPMAFNAFFAIIMISFFKGLPEEIEESGKIDGGNDLTIFFKIVLPISLPVVATIALFNAVNQWNAWFDTILFGGRDLMTVQAILVDILRDTIAIRALDQAGQGHLVDFERALFRPTIQSVQATAMMVTAIPIAMVYPFAQKYFVKGITLGSLKG